MEIKPEKKDLHRTLEGITREMRSGRSDGLAPLLSLLESHPDSLEVMGHLSGALARAERHEEAIEVYRRYLAIKPDNIEAVWRIGDRQMNLGKLDQAVRSYQKALDMNPKCTDASMGLKYIDYLKRAGGQRITAAPDRPPLTPLQKKNVSRNRSEFRKKRIRLESLPPHLYLESTTKCNFYCRTCSKGYNPYFAEDLHPDILEKVCLEVKPFNTKISITGFGEPTLSSRFDEMLGIFEQNGSLVHFVTNGSLLNFPRIEQLVRHPVVVQLSIDAAQKGTFEEVRAGSRFEQIMKRLAMIKKLRDIHIARAHSFFSFLFVAIRKNIRELPDVVRMAHKYGISRVDVIDYSFGQREFDEQSLRYDPAVGNRYLEEAGALASKLGVDMILPPPYDATPPPPPSGSPWQKLKRVRRIFPDSRRFARRCTSPWMEPYIHTNGNVTPCCASMQYLGNLKRDSFHKIWNGWRYRLFRFRIETGFPPPECRKCFTAWGINGGNAGNAMAREGLLVKILYFIEYRIKGLVYRIHRLVRSLSGRDEDRLPEPNYFRGRPLATRGIKPQTGAPGIEGGNG